MKNNKFLSIFLFFFSLMFLNIAVGEEIIFEDYLYGLCDPGIDVNISNGYSLWISEIDWD